MERTVGLQVSTITAGETAYDNEDAPPGYVEENAVLENEKASYHCRSWFITVVIWTFFVIAMIYLLEYGDGRDYGSYDYDTEYYETYRTWTILVWVAGVGFVVFCLFNYCEYRYCSSTYKYFQNLYDSQDGLIGFIGMYLIHIYWIISVIYCLNFFLTCFFYNVDYDMVHA